ncbi:Uncharacterised protein [Anaerobiospirillum thomasii]|uniref:hypothetical protein n=1 Tax=Anaerobiospirillum thomasii TaxID=179995 RepID=UPI000D8B7551|nr:hypothetical protein [Anaerobiospirillum thomasii]SPT68194.1 Uncharacterised protein [Anaerobiospirillum thomasii]
MNNYTQKRDDLNPPQIHNDPHSAHKSAIWNLAVNLVFENSADFNGYAAAVAHEHILNNIDIDKAQKAIESHYTNEQKAGARGVSPALYIICVRVAKILSYKGCNLSADIFASIQDMIFANLESLDNKAGRSPLSSNQAVFHGSYKKLCALIDDEKDMMFDKNNPDKMLEHIAIFTSQLLTVQANEFAQRLTTIIFVIMYARSLGFNLQHDFSDRHNSVATLMKNLEDHSEQTQRQSFLHIYRFLATVLGNIK